MHEQLAEARKALQSRQIECDEARKKIVNEAAVKFSTLVEQWEHLKVNMSSVFIFSGFGLIFRLKF